MIFMLKYRHMPNRWVVNQQISTPSPKTRSSFSSREKSSHQKSSHKNFSRKNSNHQNSNRKDSSLKSCTRTRRPKSRAQKAQFKILVMLSFFSISVGLWENFRQLWLQDNGFSPADISNITSLGMLAGVAGIVLVGSYLKMRQLKGFMSAVLLAKVVFLIALAFLNGSARHDVINFCMVIDVLTSNLIVISVYPLMTTIMKSNKIYSQRKLVEYLFRDVGVLIGGLIIGQQFLGMVLDYGGCLIVSMLFLLVATAIMFSFRVRPTFKEPRSRASMVKFILKSRIQTVYMVYAYLAATSFATALGLKMLILTGHLRFSVNTATNFLLIAGLLSDGIGIIALKYFTPKNDYLTMTLKFGIRLLAYVIAVVSNDVFVMLIAILWSLLSSTAYEDVSDGHYINVIDNRHQFRYSTVKYVISYLGEASGLFLAGQMFDFGVPAILGLSAAITTVQLGVAYYLIYLRQHPRARRPSTRLQRWFTKNFARQSSRKTNSLASKNLKQGNDELQLSERIVED